MVIFPEKFPRVCDHLSGFSFGVWTAQRPLLAAPAFYLRGHLVSTQTSLLFTINIQILLLSMSLHQLDSLISESYHLCWHRASRATTHGATGTSCHCTSCYGWCLLSSIVSASGALPWTEMAGEFLASCLLASPACPLLWAFPFLLLPSALIVLAFLPHVPWAWHLASFWEPPKQCVSVAHRSCQGVFSCISGNCSHLKKPCLIWLYVLSSIHDIHWLMLPLPPLCRPSTSPAGWLHPNYWSDEQEKRWGQSRGTCCFARQSFLRQLERGRC